MKQTYIEFDGYDYPTSACTFYKDCVVHYDYDSNETIMHNGHWKYVEREIVFDTLTLVEREIENQLSDTRYDEYCDNIKAEFWKQTGNEKFEKGTSDYFVAFNEFSKQYRKSHPFAG